MVRVRGRTGASWRGMRLPQRLQEGLRQRHALRLHGWCIGSLILGNGDFDFTPPPDLVGMNPTVWISDLAAWASSLGKPLFVGLIVLAASLSMLSYLAVRWGWRLWLNRQWRRRPWRAQQKGPRQARAPEP